MSRKSTEASPGDLLRPPTFGGLLRRFRDDRRVSREKLAFAAGVSSSYITHLEGGDRAHPTKAVVEALIGYLHRVAPLSDAERRHLFDLAGLSEASAPTVAQLRAEITEDMRSGLEVHEPNAAGYLDTRWNVLSCNAAYAAAFPGLVEDVNILRWFFGNEMSKRVMVDWEREAALTVDWLRGLIGQSGGGDWSTELLAELGRYPEFRRMWASGGTAYGRESPQMRLRDIETGEHFSLDVQLFRVDSGSHPGRIQFFLGIRTPQPAPPSIARRAAVSGSHGARSPVNP
ncbi:helix-turn-helix transcriptional regulator [Nocardia lijiangensis]|uniref:helix-turn-helix transcriptional regulator n=1 Tax=Nocardia lijiangensis TaxID=299618 RepID=UPI000A03225C|nr:helix-turn-helix transcriptional regulator [Nocardia lijiangensis]